MKTLALFLLMITMSSPVMASLQECRKLVKEANKVCKDDFGCKKNFLEVSDADIVQTIGSVTCRGEENLIHGKKQDQSSKKRRSKKQRKKFQF